MINASTRCSRSTHLLYIPLLGLLLSLFMAIPGAPASTDEARSLIEDTCSSCHRFEGEGKSRFLLKAPDLMWGGSKYQRTWLINWLTGKEAPLYAKGYRWDQQQQAIKHPVVSPPQAAAIADYFEQHLVDKRVEAGVFDLATVTRQDVAFGAQLYVEHACIGCHQIEQNGKLVGAPQSANLAHAGKRYNVDWLYRFAVNPQDFTPHSGEFLADVSGLGLHYIVAYVASLGVDNFPFYEPWTSAEFNNASVERGQVIYKEYCSQCHGASGQGDGPAADALTPRPAVHANIPFDQLPTEYLYNVIYHGGRSVGKSTNMPYWGLTIGQQGTADVIAYLKATFKGPSTAVAGAAAAGAVCPQPRKTPSAPKAFLELKNPLPASESHIAAGAKLFHESASPLACAQCHGDKGDGLGVMASALDPRPRNFTCKTMMQEIADGQLFWIIKNGAEGTGMMAFTSLADEQVWQLVHYIRTLAK